MRRKLGYHMLVVRLKYRTVGWYTLEDTLTQTHALSHIAAVLMHGDLSVSSIKVPIALGVVMEYAH